jgi:hypothetical protein
MPSAFAPIGTMNSATWIFGRAERISGVADGKYWSGSRQGLQNGRRQGSIAARNSAPRSRETTH